MTNQVLSNILEEEKKAADLIKEAHQSANELVKNAEARVTEAERTAAVEHRALYQQILRERREKVSLAIKDEESGLPSSVDSSLNVSGEKLQKAIDAIVEGVLHGHR